MFETIPVEVGLIHEGERVRKNDLQVELGGPSEKEKFEIVRYASRKRSRMAQSVSSAPISAGWKKVSTTRSVSSSRLPEKRSSPTWKAWLNAGSTNTLTISKGSCTSTSGTISGSGSRKNPLRKDLTRSGLSGRSCTSSSGTKLPIIEKIQISSSRTRGRSNHSTRKHSGPTKPGTPVHRGLSDQDVDTFYGCALCQSFAPTHVCVITPQRYANCGAISWFDGRAAAGIDPKGPIYAIEKGECLDPDKGEYTGVDESARKRSMGEVSRVYLYSAFGYPHTSCGCFEGIAFYIPEVDGFGIVLRGFGALTVNGLAFSTMADSTAGGRQVEGFHGISIEYMRSKKFMHADGGYDRVVWMPHETRERLKEFIPEEAYEAIATEKDVATVAELKTFLQEHHHPVGTTMGCRPGT